MKVVNTKKNPIWESDKNGIVMQDGKLHEVDELLLLQNSTPSQVG